MTRALPRILAALAETELRATFFVEGVNAAMYPDALRSIASAGHEVAYHGWQHERWSELGPTTERALLDRGMRCLAELDLTAWGFRPPGGELTRTSMSTLGELGFGYCSPAGKRVERRDGLVVLPFRWPLIDAFHYQPHFGALRRRVIGSPDPLPPERLRSTVRRALDDLVRDGGHLALVFHPFLTEPEERFAVLRDVLDRLAADGRIHSAPCRDVAVALAG